MSRGGRREPSQRQLRVGEELRHAIALILERNDIRDPDVANRAVTVTEVTVSPDLSHATVFVVPLGGGDSASLVAGLKRVRAFVRHEVAGLVKLRVTPELVFAPDISFERSSRIDALLASPIVRRDIDPTDDEE